MITIKHEAKEGNNLKLLKKFFIILFMINIIVLGICTNASALDDEDMKYLGVAGMVRDYAKNESSFEDFLSTNNISTLKQLKSYIEEIMDSDEGISTIMALVATLNVTEDEEVYLNEGNTRQALNNMLNKTNEKIEELEQQLAEDDTLGTDTSGTKTIDETIKGAQDFISNADTTGTINESALQQNIGYIYNIFFACGMVVAVACGVFLGVKFMTSSVEGQAKVKELLIPYCVGCFIIFGAFGIWRIVINIMEAFN